MRFIFSYFRLLLHPVFISATIKTFLFDIISSFPGISLFIQSNFPSIFPCNYVFITFHSVFILSSISCCNHSKRIKKNAKRNFSQWSSQIYGWWLYGAKKLPVYSFCFYAILAWYQIQLNSRVPNVYARRIYLQIVWMDFGQIPTHIYLFHLYKIVNPNLKFILRRRKMVSVCWNAAVWNLWYMYILLYLT